MRDPVLQTVRSLESRGVVFEMVDGRPRWRARRETITVDEKRLISDHAQIVAAILNPDETLPDALSIPASVPNDLASIEGCIDSQRVRKAAA